MVRRSRPADVGQKQRRRTVRIRWRGSEHFSWCTPLYGGLSAVQPTNLSRLFWFLVDGSHKPRERSERLPGLGNLISPGGVFPLQPDASKGACDDENIDRAD